jgi:small subunit ribosomal protein S8
LDSADFVLENMLIKGKFRELERLVGKYMLTNYPVGDFLIRIKNAALAYRREVACPSTKLIVAVAEVLKRSGYLSEVEVKEGEIKVSLAYKSKKPIIMDLKLISKLGLRNYMSVDDLRAKRGASIYVISTPLGVLSSKEAIKQNVGGEVIAEVW